MATKSEFHQKATQMEAEFHMSGLLDPIERDQLRIDIKERINSLWGADLLDEDSDPFDAIVKIYEEEFPEHDLAPLRNKGKRLNLLYPKNKFTAQGLSPEMVATGANFIANNTKNLTFGFDSKGYSEDKFNEIRETAIKMKLDTTGMRSDPMRTKSMDKHDVVSFQDKLKQQVLDDLMEGNAPFMYKALIPRSGGKDGYYIGVFWHLEDEAPTKAQLIGAMMDQEGKKYVVSNEELVGASASNQVLEYLTSWFFDYNHKNIKELHKSGRKPEDRVPGGGRAVAGDPEKSFLEEFPGPMQRGLATLEGKMGEIEFHHAINPLYEMMETKAKEKFGNELYDPDRHHLDEEEAQDVLREFMDRFNRPFTFLEQLPGSDITVPVARWVNNLWELDLNLREIWN